jgi:hypothetical protein
MPREHRGKTGKAEQHVGSSRKGSGITMPKLGTGSKTGTNRHALEIAGRHEKKLGASGKTPSQHVVDAIMQ